MRAEFSAATKDTLAKRAGYRCSFPDCRRLTVGPGAQPHEVAITGVAAHIYSASEGGPRGQGGLSPSELSSLANGIWLCEVHGKLVDTSRGDAYPASLLISYRALHEAWIAHELGDVPHRFGWIQELQFEEGPLFSPGERLRLGHVTLISGPNGSGKTALCNWLAGTGDAAALRRWAPVRGGRSYLRYGVRYFSPDRHDLQVTVGPEHTRFVLDSKASPFNPIPFRTVLLEAPQYQEKGESDIQYVARHLGDDPTVVANLLREIPTSASGLFDAVEVHRGGSIKAQRRGRRCCEFAVLSGGGQMGLAIEAAIVKARTLAQHYPTLLALDSGMGGLDDAGWNHYIDFVQRQREFQTVMASAAWSPKSDRTGLEVARLQFGASGVEIHQPATHLGG